MKRSITLHKPWLELLEDRLPPGSLLTGLMLSGAEFGLSLSADFMASDGALDRLAARPGNARSAFSDGSSDGDAVALVAAPPIVPASRAGDQSSSAVARFDDPISLGVADNLALTPNSLLDRLGSESPRPANGIRFVTVPPPVRSTSLEGGAATTAAGSVGVAPSASGSEVSPADARLDGVDRQILVAQVPAAAGAANALSPEYLASNGYVPPGWQGGKAGLDGTPIVNGRPNPAALRLADHLRQSGGAASAGPDGIGDPGAPGSFATTRVQYSLGNVTLSGTPGPVEVQAEVTYPTGLAGGPLPLVIFLHGRHSTCYSGASAFLEWPCAAGHQNIPSFQGYRYVADALASNDYIVVSIGANGVNARDNNVADLGAQWRAQLIQYHLDLWHTWSTTGGGPAGIGSSFIGKVDMTNIGLMGHSRGGEGVVKSYLYNQSLGSPYGINAVFPLAPVDFNRPVINNVNQAVLLPYCDGDVSDNQGIHFFDDARYNVTGDVSFKHTIEVLGANHNFYNTIWTPGGWPAGTADDWLSFVSGGSLNPYCGTVAGNGKLTPAQEQGTGLAYMSAFFRTYLGGEYQFLYYLTGDAPPPASATVGQDKIILSYQPPDAGGYRLDVNRLLTPANLTTNTLGGAVTTGGLTAPYEVCGGNAPEAQFCLTGQPTTRQPHQVPSARSSARGLSMLRLIWDNNSAFYRNDLPAGTGDVSGDYVFQFRVGVNYTDTARNPLNQPQDFSITLTDGSGASDTTLASYWATGALNFPVGTRTGDTSTPVPKLILNTVRIPISIFNVDLTNIQSVQFNFDQTPRGHIFLADEMFAAY